MTRTLSKSTELDDRQLSEDGTAEYEHLLSSIDMTWIDDAGHLLPGDAPAQLVERLIA
jgi:hypothetical protein